MRGSQAKLQPSLEILENHLTKNRFFGGDSWDMADFMVASVCYTFFVMNYDPSKVPAFQKWLLEGLERPMAREVRALRE